MTTINDEIILSIPKDKLGEIIQGFESPMLKAEAPVLDNSPMLLMGNFPQPEVYSELFRKWGLDRED